MTVKDLEDLYDYDSWASKKLFEVISQLSPEEFTRDVAGSYGSIRNTLVHVVSAEWGWLDRCGGPARGPRLNAADYPTVESLITTWTTVAAHVREFLSTLIEDRVRETGPAWLRSAEVRDRIENYLRSGTSFSYLQAALQPVPEPDPTPKVTS